jgi:regulator of sigma E protease
MCLIAADVWSLWMWIGVILKVAFGLGAVIFVHELGHFLVAKACGVKCEKFMIGFDIGGYKLSWRRGETEYGIGILPLGGYVKMLGQDDDPAHIAEQMQKSQVDAKSSDAVPVTGPSGETYYVDRRSYLAKSVPQRMAIISAGVIMNVIFAFIFAVLAYGMGVSYWPAIVSDIVPGSPAWQARFDTGDEILQINETVDPTFVQLKGDVTLGDLEHGVKCRIRRAADGKVETVILKPQQDGGRLATIGIGGPQSLTIMDVVDGSPAARATLVEPAGSKIAKADAKFKEGDLIVRVGDSPVKDYRELAAELEQQAEEDVRVAVERKVDTDKDAKSGDAASNEPATHELTFEVPKQQLRHFDFDMKMGPITSVREDSPAAKAGLAADDVIEKVDGKQMGEGENPLATWTAATLPNYLYRAAKAGREVEITVARPTNDGKSESVSVRIKPVVPTLLSSVFPPRSPGTPMGSNEIGIAYRIENEVAAVTPNSPVAADLAAGDRINSVEITYPKDKDGKASDSLTVKLVRNNPGWMARLIRAIFGGEFDTSPLPNWPRVLDAAQFIPEGTEFKFTVQRGDAEPRTINLKPTLKEGGAVASRGFWFKPIERIRKAESFGQQLQYGWDETTEALTMVFRFLKKLGTQVPISALGGPVTIAKAAGYSAAESLSSLLIFLTMLSANLAVINLLPIPLLDGGHLVFLAYEGIRRRPANEKFVVALHTAGFVLIVSLMLYVLALDLELIPRNL